jgi:hypothetical protein
MRLGLGRVTTDLLPSGPDGATLACVQCALYLVNDADGPVALLARGPEEHMSPGVTVEASPPWPSGRGGWTTRRCCRCPAPVVAPLPGGAGP